MAPQIRSPIQSFQIDADGFHFPLDHLRILARGPLFFCISLCCKTFLVFSSTTPPQICWMPIEVTILDSFNCCWINFQDFSSSIIFMRASLFILLENCSLRSGGAVDTPRVRPWFELFKQIDRELCVEKVASSWMLAKAIAPLIDLLRLVFLSPLHCFVISDFLESL